MILRASSRAITRSFVAIIFLLFAPLTFAEKVITGGQFTGASGHVTKGTASIVKADKGLVLVLGSDFYLDGAPDPRVGFGKDGQYIPSSELKKLISTTGEQRYTLPSSIKLDKYNEVYIWCELFSVPLGIAQLN